MKILAFFSTVLVILLCQIPVNANADAPLDRDIKIFTYWQTCNCYMMTFDDLANDGCEYFVNGKDLWDNGNCD